MYCIFLIFAIMISTYTLLFGKETFFYNARMLLATLVPTALILVLARYRLFFIDLLLPLNTITRGIIGIYLRRRHKSLPCKNTALEVARDYLGLTLFIADYLLLKSNWLISVGNYPIFGLFSVFKQKDKSMFVQKCSVKVGERVLAYGFIFLALLPGAYSIWTWVY